jgi:enoyl-CoA hydratase/carnithine racemase
MQMTQVTLVEYQQEERVAIIRLNRPEKLNAFNRDMYRQFNEAIGRFNADPESYVAIITGTGSAFSAGVDVQDVQAALKERPGTPIKELAAEFSIDMEDLEFTEKPVIAAINGHCYGEGLSLAISCDLRIAVADAQFCMPEVKIGVPSVHGTLRLVHNLGLGNALELLMLGDPVDSQWALRNGLINKMVAPEDLMDNAMQWAQKIVALDPFTVKAAREIAVKCQFLDLNDTVDLGWRLRKNAKFTGGKSK